MVSWLIAQHSSDPSTCEARSASNIERHVSKDTRTVLYTNQVGRIPSPCKLFLADIKCLPEKDRHLLIMFSKEEAKDAGESQISDEFWRPPESTKTIVEVIPPTLSQSDRTRPFPKIVGIAELPFPKIVGTRERRFPKTSGAPRRDGTGSWSLGTDRNPPETGADELATASEVLC